jgi:diaminopimelate decarboxylase
LCPRIGWNAQFGLYIRNGEATEGFKLLVRNKNLIRIKGVHVHIGSQITDKKIYAKVIKEVMTFLHTLKKDIGLDIEYLDVGGGFGVPTVREISGIERKICDLIKRPFSPPNPNLYPSIENFGKIIKDTVDYYASRFKLKSPRILFEPGRLLTSSAQILLLSVRATKKRETPAVILDGGKMNITFPTSFEYHEIFVANKMKMKSDSRYCLVGRTCTPSDMIYNYRKLPALDNGDIISIMDAGAYFTSFSNSFAFPRPCILLADDGRITVVRKRETFETMASRDIFQ